MNTNTVAVSGWTALSAVHPKHAEIIRARNASMREGAVVTIDLVETEQGYISTNLGGGFTGIERGEQVVVRDYNTYGGHVSTSVSRLAQDAASLSVNSGMSLAATDPAHWGSTESVAASVMAEKAATEKMETALTYAVGHSRGATRTVDHEKAIECLTEAHALRGYAFACSILAEYIVGMEDGNGYHVGAYLRATGA